MWLRQVDLGSEHSEPHAFTSSFGAGDVFGIAGGLSHGLLFACGPRDHAVSKGETVSANRFARVGAAGITGVGEAHKFVGNCM